MSGCDDHPVPQPATCVECMATAPPPPLPRGWQPVGSTFPARYPGDCLGCTDPIDHGDLVRRYDAADGSRTVYVHPGCPLPT